VTGYPAVMGLPHVTTADCRRWDHRSPSPGHR
jgi:hypothetical protein